MEAAALIALAGGGQAQLLEVLCRLGRYILGECVCVCAFCVCACGCLLRVRACACACARVRGLYARRLRVGGCCRVCTLRARAPPATHAHLLELDHHTAQRGPVPVTVQLHIKVDEGVVL